VIRFALALKWGRYSGFQAELCREIEQT